MKPFPLQFVFMFSLVVSLVLTPFFIRLAKRFKIVDHLGHRKTHRTPVAYLGGMAIFISFALALATVVFLFPDLGIFTLKGFLKAFFILASTWGVALLGLWDDAANIRPRTKLTGQLVFALAFTLFGFRFEVFHLPGLPPVDLGLLSVPVTVFWILSVVNAFNMIDGMDGLAGTVSAGSLALLAAAAALVGNAMELVLALSVLGAVLGFMAYNWKPASIYLGDSGSSGLGMFLACALISLGQVYGHPETLLQGAFFGQPFFYQILTATLLVAYPALEILLSVARRLFRGRPVHRADRGHIHHRLLKAGWSVHVICLTALALTLLPGLAALATIARYHGVATWLLSFCGILIGLGLSTLGFLDFLKPKMMERLRPHYQVAHHFIAMQKIKLRLAANQTEVLVLVNQTCSEFGVQSYRLFIRPDNEGMGGCHCFWEKAAQEHREHLVYLKTVPYHGNAASFRDHLNFENGRGEAFWIFEPETEEGELDVEYRVLISEFMQEVLGRIALLPTLPRLVGSSRDEKTPVVKISSNLLRRRHRSKGMEQ